MDHVRRVKAIYWPDSETESGRNIQASDSRTLELVNHFHGDHDEDWIAEYVNGVEVARHNARYIESILWEV